MSVTKLSLENPKIHIIGKTKSNDSLDSGPTISLLMAEDANRKQCKLMLNARSRLTKSTRSIWIGGILVYAWFMKLVRVRVVIFKVISRHNNMAICHKGGRPFYTKLHSYKWT